MKKIGFIGTGVMGVSMASNLMKAGYDVSVYTRTKSKAQGLIESGAIWCDSIKELVKDSEVVISIVGYPKDVEEVYLGTDGIIQHAKPSTIVIDMTTSSPELAKKIYDAANKKKIHALDAPVTGGDIGAQNGTLSIMIGGDLLVYEACKEIFACLGTTVVYHGVAGNGQHCKLANQIGIAGAISAVAEIYKYASVANLDMECVMDSVSGGSASSWQMVNMLPKAVGHDFAPGFFIKHFVKDMRLANQEMTKAGVSLEMLQTVLQMYSTLLENGEGELGTQALVKYYE